MPLLDPNPLVYNAGLDLIPQYLLTAAGDFEWMLFADTYTPSTDHALVDADLIPATHELAVVGYARDTSVGGGARTVDQTNDLVKYDINDLTFGTTPADTAAEYAILIYSPAGDATAVPVLCAQLNDLTRAALPDVGVSVRGLVRYSQA